MKSLMNRDRERAELFCKKLSFFMCYVTSERAWNENIYTVNMKFQNKFQSNIKMNTKLQTLVF